MALVYTNTAKVAEDPARLLATSEKEGAPGSINPEVALLAGPPGGSSTISLEGTHST
jgi:hypothetical protein